MLRPIAARDHSTLSRARLICLACAVLISITATVPLYAQDVTAISTPVQVAQPLAPPTLGLRQGEKVLVASDKPMEPVTVAAVNPVPPVHSSHSLLSNGAVDAVAAGLLLIPFDKTLEKSITKSDDAATQVANSFGTPLTLFPIIGAVYLSGDKQTAGEAFTAWANVSIITEVVKVAAGRDRPLVGDQQGTFHGPSLSSGRESFPSGHTSSAFAVATVLAKKHPKQSWLYYGIAGAVGLARIRSSAHFPSDVLVGAGIGIYAGNQAANHRPGPLSIRF